MSAVLLAVATGLAAWIAIALLVGVPLSRWLRRRRREDSAPAVRRTERGTYVGLLALGVLVAIAVAVGTRGQVVTWDGLVAVPA